MVELNERVDTTEEPYSVRDVNKKLKVAHNRSKAVIQALQADRRREKVQLQAEHDASDRGKTKRSGRDTEASTNAVRTARSRATSDSQDQRNNRIREHRARRGWTLYQLAEKLGTSAAQVSRLERSDRKLTQEWLKKLSVALCVSQADLLNDPHGVPGKGQPKRNAQEGRLLLLWRDLDRKAQDVIMRMLDQWTNHTGRG